MRKCAIQGKTQDHPEVGKNHLCQSKWIASVEFEVPGELLSDVYLARTKAS